MGAASKEMKSIIAFRAQLEQMASTNLKLSKHLTKKQGTSATPGKPSSNESSDKSKGQQIWGKKKKNKKDSLNKKKQKKDEAWIKVPPNDGEVKTKTVNGKTWHWCIHHMSWTMHKPEECKLGMAQAQQCSNSHMAVSQSHSLHAYSALIQEVANLACSSFESGWSDQEWWFRLVWHHCLHGFCVMAEASKTIKQS